MSGIIGWIGAVLTIGVGILVGMWLNRRLGGGRAG